MVISNCEITKQDSEVLRSCVMSTDSAEYKQTKAFYTGTDLRGDKIYAAYSGTVVLIGEDESGKCVIIQTGSSFCVSYKHLLSTNVTNGQYVDKGDYIGMANKYVHVELLQKFTSIWPVRIGSSTWFKGDTQSLFDHSLESAEGTAYTVLNRVETLISVNNMLSDN